MFRRDFFASLGILPFFSLSKLSKRKEEFYIIDPETKAKLFVNSEGWVYRREEYGTKRYFNKKGQLHRENDLPALEWSGGKAWFKEGKHYRLNGPDIEHNEGTKYWHKENKLELIEYSDGTKHWYKEGKFNVCEFTNGKTLVSLTQGVKQNVS